MQQDFLNDKSEVAISSTLGNILLPRRHPSAHSTMDRDRINLLRTVDIVERGNTHEIVVQLETSVAIDVAKDGTTVCRRSNYF